MAASRGRVLKALAVLAVLAAVAGAVLPAFGSTAMEVTIDPNAQSSAPGYVQLDGLTYDAAKATLASKQTVTLPLAISGLELLRVTDVALDSSDTGHSLSLSGTANVPAVGSVPFLVTAVWPDATSTAPQITLGAKASNIGLSSINPQWSSSFGATSLSKAQLVVAGYTGTLDPATLPASAQGFYDGPIDVSSGVSLRGSLHLDGRLADAFGYAGWSGDVALTGTVGASPALLFGHADSDQLGALELTATLGRSPTAPAWLTARTSDFKLKLAHAANGSWSPEVHVADDVTVSIDGTAANTDRFKGSFDVGPDGAIGASLDAVGTLHLPYGLDALNLSDVHLGMTTQKDAAGARTFTGSLDLKTTLPNVPDPVGLHAELGTGGGETSLRFSADGNLTVGTLGALASGMLGTGAVTVPGADDVALNGVSFSILRRATTAGVEHIFSVGADATIKALSAGVLLSIRREPDGAVQPLLGLKVTDPGCGASCIRLSSLLPGDQLSSTVGALQLPALDLTVAGPSLTSLAKADMTTEETSFFSNVYTEIPTSVSFSPGINLEGRLPLDAFGDDARSVFGYNAGSEVVLAGTIGADVTLSRVRGNSSFSLNQLELSAELPKTTAPSFLPSWVTQTSPTTVAFRYDHGGVSASFETGAHLTVGSQSFDTTLKASVTKAADRTTVSFKGSLGDWHNPFGLSWVDQVKDAGLEVTSSFGGVDPVKVDAHVNGSFVLGGNTFSLDLAVAKDDSTSASLTAGFDGHLSLGDVASLFPNLNTASTSIGSNGALNGLTLDHLSATVSVGAGASSSAFALSAHTQFTTPSGSTALSSSLLVAARASGFTVGIRPTAKLHVGDFLPSEPNVNLELPKAALVLSSEANAVRVSDLTDQEFDFYKELYGCAADAGRDACTDFKKLDAQQGLRFLASFTMPHDLGRMAGAVGIQTSTTGLLEGTVPVLGGSDFSLRASLGNFRFDGNAPDWFDHGNVALQVGTEGVSFTGDLTLKLRHQADTAQADCPADGWINDHCYDLLTFRVGTRLALEPLSFTLTGALETGANAPWHPFGLSWLAVRHLGLELGVVLAPEGPAVQFGFQGDISLGDKDIAGAINVSVPPPPDVPVLLGVSAASNSGVALTDVVKFANAIQGTDLAVDTSTMPDVSLRNFLFQYSTSNDTTLCLKAGVHFNADLYVGSNLPAPDPPKTTDGGCRVLQTHPAEGQSCQDHANQGCLASVYGSIDSSGIDIGGDLSAFTLGPISFDNSHVGLTLTASKQQLQLHGHAKIASPGYTFADGRADLDFSKDGFAFSSDAAILNGTFHGYVAADVRPLDFSRVPSVYAKVWLRADADAAINQAISGAVQGVRPVIVGAGAVLQSILDSGGIPQINDIRTKLINAGIPVPPELDKVIKGIGDAQDELNKHGLSAVSLNTMFKGFDISSDGTPGFYVPEHKECWPYIGIGTHDCTLSGTILPGTTVYPTCVTKEINGTCYSIPPFSLHVPGICDAIGIDHNSSDCTFGGIMARYVLPAVLDKVNQATGLNLHASNLQDVIDQLVTTLSNPNVSILSLDCAEFEADARQLAQGQVNATLAARLRLFGHPISLGAHWDFGNFQGNASTWTTQLLQQLLSPQPATCPDIPAGHENQAMAVADQHLSAQIAPSAVDENGDVTFTGTFSDDASNYPAVVVDWGDGSSDTIAAGTDKTVSHTHRYLNNGPGGFAVAQYPIRAVVQDGGHDTQELTATVRNVAPAIDSLSLDHQAIDENGDVRLSGRFTDPGTLDRHHVTVDWGDGSAPDRFTAPLGDRSFSPTHRYLDNPASGTAYTIAVTVGDGDGGTANATKTVDVNNVTPASVTLKPAQVLSGGGDALPDGTVRVDEGSVVNYAVDFTDPGTLDGHKVTIDFADGTDPVTVDVGPGVLHVDVPHRYLDDTLSGHPDGTYGVAVTIRDKDGATATTTTPVRVHNVAPQVQTQLDSSRIAEGGSVTLTGQIIDPGTLDDQTVVIDWGAGRTGADRTTTLHLPADQRTFTTTKPYGDNGTFTVDAAVTDKDAGHGDAQAGLSVDNVAPTAAIDGTGSVAPSGARTFIARAGVPFALKASTTDPGSDDLTAVWKWQDGSADTTTPYLLAAPALDPLPSPQVGPRDLVDGQTHTWTSPCLYPAVRFTSTDDDGGVASDTADVVVTATDRQRRGAGYWAQLYRKSSPAGRPTAAQLDCYLRIVDHMSTVFNEAGDASTPAAAYAVLHPGGPDDDVTASTDQQRAHLDAELLATWLNFAAGALDYGKLAGPMAAAEKVRLDPAATWQALHDARVGLKDYDGD